MVLDQIGAEKLTGNGDMLFFAGAETTRVQCAYTSIEDVMATCDEIAESYADYDNKDVTPEKKRVSTSFPVLPWMISWSYDLAKVGEFFEENIPDTDALKKMLQVFVELDILEMEIDKFGRKKYTVKIRDNEELDELLMSYIIP